jgi:AraC-like DNA-binding protein
MARQTRTSHRNVKNVRFHNERLSALGIEPMRLSALRSGVGAARMREPERVDFFMLMLVMSGQGSHRVDFKDWPLTAGSLLFVRPGQVQQWASDSDYEAQLILIAPSAFPFGNGMVASRELEHLGLDDWQTCVSMQTRAAQEVGEDLRRLQRDFDRFESSELDVALIRHELMALVVRLAKLQHAMVDNSVRQSSRPTYRIFQRELETSFRHEHSLAFYARRLGYAQSTISRACLAAEGRSAKQVIDRRIALEAQRLLVHSTASVMQIAHQLGFSEATNFVKFFRRMIGSTPSAFRLSCSV